MSKPKLFGISNSRALRALWGMEEVGIEYDHVPVNYGEESKSKEYLSVNPNGRIPALIDGDLTLVESMAINLYLTKRYGKDLYPSTPELEARAWQWSVWGISEIEPLQMQIVIQKLFVPEEKRDAKVIERAGRGLQRPLKVLDEALAGQNYLLGPNFSVADLNVASVMLLLKDVQFDYSAFINVTRWAKACYARPALARAVAKP